MNDRHPHPHHRGADLVELLSRAQCLPVPTSHVLRNVPPGLPVMIVRFTILPVRHPYSHTNAIESTRLAGSRSTFPGRHRLVMTRHRLPAERHRLLSHRNRDMVPRVPLVPTTIRFAPEAMELIERAAQQMGTSVAQFVREAAIVRAMVVENDPETKHLADTLLAAHEGSTAQRLARRRP